MFVKLTVQRVAWPSDTYVVDIKGVQTAVNAITRAADMVGQSLEQIHGDGMDHDEKFEASQTDTLLASTSQDLHNLLSDYRDDDGKLSIDLTLANALWTFPNGTVWHLDGL